MQSDAMKSQREYARPTQRTPRLVGYTQRANRVALAGAIALSVGVAPVAAQTRFMVPDIPADVAHYTRVSQCVAAVARVGSEEELKGWKEQNMLPDTMPEDFQEPFRPLPASVVATAQRCAARWTPAAANLTEFDFLFPLFLSAGRDADAAALLTRRLAAVGPKRGGDTERTAIIFAAANMYTNAQPARLAAAESILTALVRQTSDRIERLQIYLRLGNLAEVFRDTAGMRHAGQHFMALADSLTPAERESFNNRVGPVGVVAAMAWAVGEKLILDSLRRGTRAYVGLMRTVWTKVAGLNPESYPFPVGEKVPPITADFWFPRDSDHGTRPTPGRVALVVFLDRIACVDSPEQQDFASDDRRDEYRSGQCWRIGANLRRLAERFPELEITCVTQTHGYFLYAPPPAPAEEAAYIARWVAGHGIPGTLAVSSTSFWNLDPPDGRRINRPDSNAVRYSSGKSSYAHRGMYLVDRDGTLVDAPAFRALDFPLLAAEIEILLSHRGATDASGARF